jgi:glycosyltransferase involved in cell wall biosynthesis
LSLSLIAREQFLQAGFRKDSLYPFGYFVPRHVPHPVMEEIHDSSLRLIFVGSLLKRKGLDIAVKAIEILNNRGNNVFLDIYGPGNPEGFIPEDLTRINFRGKLRREEVQSVMSQYDALILPSRHDGWGAVVNEALLQGVPAIVSDRVGAKCLLESTGAGLIFKSEDVANLVRKLEQLCEESSMLKDLKVKALEMGQYILPNVAAQYLLDVFNYHFGNKQRGRRPNAIWCGQDS